MMIGNTALEDNTRAVACQDIRATDADAEGVFLSWTSSRQNSKAPIRLASAAR